MLGSTWPQQHGVLSALVPPERYAAFAAADPATRTREALDQVAELYGPEATSPLQTWTRLWGTDPWTQGYVTNWRPGDVEAVGPLHGTHEPPFYVCGSDQWVAGYMEGAVRTGRGAAAAALAGLTDPTAQENHRMDFGLTDEQRSIVEVTRAFVERELYPHEEEVERTGVLRPELAAQIREQGPGRRSGRRQHARGGRRGGPRHGHLGALREGARPGQLRPAVHRGRRGPPTSCWPAPRRSASATSTPACGARGSTAWR